VGWCVFGWCFFLFLLGLGFCLWGGVLGGGGVAGTAGGEFIEKRSFDTAAEGYMRWEAEPTITRISLSSLALKEKGSKEK